MNLRHLRTFVTIAETGSFQAAAERLFLTQSAVSMQMKRLEEVTGSLEVGKRADVLVLDVPLLFEGRARGGRGARVDATVAVWVPVDVQLARTMARDGCSREAAQRRIDAQMPLDEKRALADHVIDNSGSLDDTEAQVRALHARLRTPHPPDG